MKKILVVDYDQSSLQALQKTLTQEGFEVVLAGDGQAGWEKFQSEKPDLVLMEAMLSKIHGFELCDRITKDPVSKTPVFIMTGVYKDRVYRTEALRTYGASEYFEKPLDMPKFLASIHGLLTVPDIKPGPEAEPSNGGPKNGNEPVPVVKPAPEPARRTEPPAEPRPPRPEPPRPRTATESHGGGGGVGGLNLETILNVHPQPKAKPAADAKAHKDDELRLEALLNDIAAAAEERHRPEPPKSAPPVPAALKEAEAKSHEHAHKDQQAADIDRLLKTTLADFGLEAEKKKPARPVPEPAPARTQAPERPRQAAPVAPAPRTQAKPVPPPAPPPAFAEKPKTVAPPAAPPAVQEKAKPAAPPTPPPAVAEKPKQAQPAPRPVPPPVKPKSEAKPEAKAEPRPEPKPQPAAAKPEARPHVREAEPQKSPDGRIFKDIYEVEKKKSPLPFIAIGAGIVAVAVVGFLLLRPKHNPNLAGAVVNSPATQTQPSVSEKAPDTTLPSLSEEKLKAVNPKPKPTPQASRPVENLPGAAEAIAPPTITDVSRLNAKTGPEKKPEAKPAQTAPAETKPAETKPSEAKATDVQTSNPQTAVQGAGQPPAGTETAAPQGTPAGAGDAGAAPAPAAKANPGDLVPLASVDEAPKIVKSFDPAYPAQAARFGKGGSVTVNALINESGAVAETGILKGLKDDMGMEKAAMDAVRKWKFQPAKKDGVNVKVWKPIVITFRPAQTRTP